MHFEIVGEIEQVETVAKGQVFENLIACEKFMALGVGEK